MEMKNGDVENERGRSDGSGAGVDLRRPLIAARAKATPAAAESGEESILMVLLSTFVAVCGAFEFGSFIGFSAPAQEGIREDLALTVSEYSVFGSLMNIGSMIGAVASGRTADRIGRKGAMGSSGIICILGWFAIFFAQGPVLLDVGRFLGGYGIGVLSYVVPVFIAEITPKYLRGALTTINQLMICTGISVAYIVGVFIPWRALALTGVVPCLVLIIGLFFIPESPRWLAKMGRTEEFKAALRKLRGKNANITDEALEIQEYIETLESLPKARIQDLFDRRYVRAVIAGVGLMVFQQFGGINGIMFYASHICTSAGFASGDLGTILLGVIQVPITTLGAFLMDRSGRRLLLMISSSGILVGSFLCAVSFSFQLNNMYGAVSPYLALAGMLIFVGFFSIGMGAIPWVIMSEIFPINIKGIAGSLVTLVNWFGSWVVSFAFNFLMGWNSAGTWFIFTAVNVATILFVAEMVPETKGRTLEEIQSSLNRGI